MNIIIQFILLHVVVYVINSNCITVNINHYILNNTSMRQLPNRSQKYNKHNIYKQQYKDNTNNQQYSTYNMHIHTNLSLLSFKPAYTLPFIYNPAFAYNNNYQQMHAQPNNLHIINPNLAISSNNNYYTINKNIQQQYNYNLIPNYQKNIIPMYIPVLSPIYKISPIFHTTNHIIIPQPFNPNLYHHPPINRPPITAPIHKNPQNPQNPIINIKTPIPNTNQPLTNNIVNSVVNSIRQNNQQNNRPIYQFRNINVTITNNNQQNINPNPNPNTNTNPNPNTNSNINNNSNSDLSSKNNSNANNNQIQNQKNISKKPVKVVNLVETNQAYLYTSKISIPAPSSKTRRDILSNIPSSQPSTNTTNIPPQTNNSKINNNPINTNSSSKLQQVNRSISIPPTNQSNNIKLKYTDYLQKYKPNNLIKLSQQQLTFREAIFINNLNTINLHNIQSNKSYKMGLNLFTDIAQQQFINQFLKLQVPEQKLKQALLAEFQMRQNFGTVVYTKPVEIVVDWSCHASAVISQGACGASYVIAALQSLQITMKIYNRTVSYLSIQQILSCSSNMPNGCTSGFYDTIYQYIQKKGVGQSQFYYYNSKDQRDGVIQDCNQTLIDTIAYSKTKVFIKQYKNIKFADCNTLVNILKTRSLAVAIAADKLQFYQSGTFKTNNTYINHAVTVIGYYPDKKYLIKNSWDVNWGLNGYAFVDQTTGICNYASYPILVDQNETPQICKNTN